jgi:hypothetical protein
LTSPFLFHTSPVYFSWILLFVPLLISTIASFFVASSFFLQILHLSRLLSLILIQFLFFFFVDGHSSFCISHLFFHCQSWRRFSSIENLNGSTRISLSLSCKVPIISGCCVELELGAFMSIFKIVKNCAEKYTFPFNLGVHSIEQ